MSYQNSKIIDEQCQQRRTLSDIKTEACLHRGAGGDTPVTTAYSIVQNIAEGKTCHAKFEMETNRDDKTIRRTT